MKVTKREPEELGKSLDFSKIKPGTVFKYEDSVFALKITDNKAVLLNDEDGSDWFCLAENCEGYDIAEILGKLVEIVVE